MSGVDRLTEQNLPLWSTSTEREVESKEVTKLAYHHRQLDRMEQKLDHLGGAMNRIGMETQHFHDDKPRLYILKPATCVQAIATHLIDLIHLEIAVKNNDLGEVLVNFMRSGPTIIASRFCVMAFLD